MVGYLDSSVLLRILLREPKKLDEISRFSELVSNELIRVECLRVLYRLRLNGRLSDDKLTNAVIQAQEFLAELSIIPLTTLVLDRASLPLPTVIGTLDAIHICSAQLWSERKGKKITMLSHDLQVLSSARALGMSALG